MLKKESNRNRIRKALKQTQDLDPFQNVSDPEHCWKVTKFGNAAYFLLRKRIRTGPTLRY
jgi:hypothetical protein